VASNRHSHPLRLLLSKISFRRSPQQFSFFTLTCHFLAKLCFAITSCRERQDKTRHRHGHHGHGEPPLPSPYKRSYIISTTAYITKIKQTFHSDPLIFRVFDRHCIGRAFMPRGISHIIEIGETIRWGVATAAAVMFNVHCFSNRRADMCHCQTPFLGSSRDEWEVWRKRERKKREKNK
jgi:hypothetical protein